MTLVTIVRPDVAICGLAHIDSSRVADSVALQTFLADGAYNATNWITGDLISAQRMNKLEDGLFWNNYYAKLSVDTYDQLADIDVIYIAEGTHFAYVKNEDKFYYYTEEKQWQELKTGGADVTALLKDYAKTSDIPTKVSQLINDKGYLVSIPEQYATKQYVDNEIKEQLGDLDIDIDLTEYATKDDLHSHSNKSVLDGITSAKVTSWDNKSTFDGNYNSLTNKPTIPTVTNDLTNTLKSNYDSAYTHSTSSHAPSNAQKNSDITKAEIEAKLTGQITSHSHNYLSSIPSEYVTETELNAKGYATQSYVTDNEIVTTFYGTSESLATDAEKIITVDDPKFTLRVGTLISVKFSISNTAKNVTLNVNGTGAYPIWFNTSEYTSTSAVYCGNAGRPIFYMFNGTHWVWINGSYYPSYSPASLGFGYGVCDTAEATVAKAVTISSYALVVGGIVAIKFTNTVPANATLNIRTRGAKGIFYNGSAITSGIIKAGDTATFVYDGTQYQLISIDRDETITKTSQLTDDVGFAKQSEVDRLSEEIVNHKNDNSVHVTSAEKQVWNNKANKTDIPTITQEAGESESLVMSQKAVTDLVNEAVGEATKIEYETVDSIAEMTDTSKQYVLSTDGYIYTFTETTGTVTHEAENKFVPADAQINKRMGSSSLSAQNGFVWSGAIPVDLTKESPFRVKVEGTKITEDTSETQKLWLCADNTGRTKLSAAVIMLGRESLSNYTTLLEDGTIYADYKASAKLSDSIITGTKYLRIGFKFSDSAIGSTSELSGVKITFPSEAYTEEVTTSKWVCTEMKPSANGNGANYVDLLVKVNQNKTDIEEANKRITALASGSEVLTVPSFWQSAVDECIAKIKAVQVGRNCVTFPFFSDNHQRNGYAGTLIAYIMRECNIPYCFFGGDAISNGSDVTSEAIMISQDKAFDNMMSVIPAEKMCRTLGNHDAYWNPTPDSGSSTRVYYTREQIYDLFLRQESVSQNKHYGGDGTFYYVDDIASKTRFVVCNMNVNVNTTTEKLDSTQLEWLENKVMVFDESGWGLVFISHQPITNHYHSNIYAETASAIQTLLTNYANGSGSNKADIIGWFAGHIHCDRIYTGVASNTTDDSVKNTLAWKTVTIRADATNLCRDTDLVHTVANDDKSHAIDFVTINKTTRTVNITRLGIGSDRSYTY